MSAIASRKTIGYALRRLRFLRIAVALSCAFVVADSAMPPGIRTFSSAYGRWWVEVIPVQRGEVEALDAATCRLFFGRADKVAELKLSIETDFIPSRVLVSETGQMVLVNNYYRNGIGTVLAVLDTKGAVAHRFRLKDLLSKDEIAAHTIETVSNRIWTHETQFRFKDNRLEVKFDWGKTILIDLKLGNLE